MYAKFAVGDSAVAMIDGGAFGCSAKGELSLIQLSFGCLTDSILGTQWKPLAVAYQPGSAAPKNKLWIYSFVDELFTESLSPFSITYAIAPRFVCLLLGMITKNE